VRLSQYKIKPMAKFIKHLHTCECTNTVRMGSKHAKKYVKHVHWPGNAPTHKTRVSTKSNMWKNMSLKHVLQAANAPTHNQHGIKHVEKYDKHVRVHIYPYPYSKNGETHATRESTWDQNTSNISGTYRLRGCKHKRLGQHMVNQLSASCEDLQQW
jgi:hypothetical protein